MHSELVTSRSASIVAITGPAAAGPSSATSSGTPMKPELGNAATSAPKAASRVPTRAFSETATVNATTTSAASRYTPSSAGLNSSRTGVFMPRRSSRLGSAKYRTKALSPGMALSGSTRARAASQPASTRAKNGTVTSRIGGMARRVSQRRPSRGWRAGPRRRGAGPGRRDAAGALR